MTFALLGAVVALRGLALLAPQVVEPLYARGLFPHIVAALTALSSLAPFSLAEALLILLASLALARALGALVRRWRGRGGQAARATPTHRPRRLAGLAASVAAAYLAFLLVWGLNYERWPATRLFQLDGAGGPTGELLALVGELADGAARQRAGLAEGAGGVAGHGDADEVLARAPRGYAALTAEYPWLPRLAARPKALMSSALFSRLGITGIYMPFTGEAHVNVDAPAVLWPATACHELAHQHGFAREDEASFVGYLAGRAHPDQDFRYSATFDALGDVLVALGRVAPGPARDAFTRFDPGVRRDFRALDAWLRRHAGPARDVASSVNDAYLRSQGQADGVRSYGRVVDLLLAERRQRLASRDRPAASRVPLSPDRPTASATR